MTNLDFTQRFGESTAMAMCKVTPKYCSSRERKRFGVLQVFHFVSKLPSRDHSKSCEQLRDECEVRCLETKVFFENEFHERCNLEKESSCKVRIF